MRGSTVFAELDCLCLFICSSVMSMCHGYAGSEQGISSNRHLALKGIKQSGLSNIVLQIAVT
jgi:hypothetical protein